MGIARLKQYIKSCIKTKSLEDYRGCKMAVDTSIYMYKYKYGGNFLRLFNNQIKKFRKYDIDPIYIFDGRPNERKLVIKERKERREMMEEKLESLRITDNEINTRNESNETESDARKKEIAKAEKQIIKVTKEDNDNLKKLLDMNGVNYWDKCDGYDAEGVCSLLSKRNDVNVVLSCDIDTLTYGGVEVILNIDKNDRVEVLRLDDILEYLKLSYPEFVRMCIMCGCDYYKGEKGFGPSKSHKMILKEEGKGVVTDEYMDLMKIFMDVDMEQLEWLEKVCEKKKEIDEFVALNDIKRNLV